MTEPIEWIGTPEACARLGVTLRTLYRFIDEGQLPAYKMGRVIRLQAHEVDAFIKRARIVPGTLEHLYPDPDGFVVDTPMGRYTGVKEMIEMSRTPGDYKHPLTPLGSWQPSWL